jgi:hypothetical protein
VQQPERPRHNRCAIQVHRRDSAWGQGYVNDSKLNTGKKLMHKKVTIVSSLSCGYYEDNTFVGNFGNTGGALESWSNPNWEGGWPFSLQYGNQSLMQFPTTTLATGYMNAAHAKYNSCGSFSAPDTGDANPGGGTVLFTTVSVTATTVSGYRAFSVVQMVARSESSGAPWYLNSIFVLVGTDVFNVSVLTGDSDGPSTSITSTLIHHVLAAQQHS